MRNHLKHNPILGIALGLCIADACILAVGISQPKLVAIISLLAAGFAFASFFFKPKANNEAA
jgi:hypothetical protein